MEREPITCSSPFRMSPSVMGPMVRTCRVLGGPHFRRRHTTWAVGGIRCDLMRRLDDVSRPTRHALKLVRYLVAQRSRLAASYRYVSHSPENVSQVLQEAKGEADRIAAAEGRTGMVQELVAGFLEASERRRNEDRWGNLYEEDAADDSDDFAEASALEAGSRWHPAA